MKKIALDGATGLLMGGTVGLGLGGTAGLLMNKKLGLAIGRILKKGLGPVKPENTLFTTFTKLQQNALQLIMSIQNPANRYQDGIYEAWLMGSTVFELITLKLGDKSLRDIMEKDDDLKKYVDVLAATHTRDPQRNDFTCKKETDVSIADLADKLYAFNDVVTVTSQKRMLARAAELVTFALQCMYYFFSKGYSQEEFGQFNFWIQRGDKPAKQMWNAWTHYYDAQM